MRYINDLDEDRQGIRFDGVDFGQKGNVVG